MESKILERVRKLLSLATSSNANEAANAAKAAQELMTRHAISEAMLDVTPDQDERDEAIENDLLHAPDSAKFPFWKGRLGVALCEVNQTKCYYGRDNDGRKNLRIVGRASDAATVRYLFAYIASEIDRLTGIEARKRGSPGKTWCNNFKMGAAEEVARRLKEAYRETRAAMRREASASDTFGNGVALVRVDTAIAKIDKRKQAVDEWIERNLKLGKATSTRQRFDAGAREAGRRAGASIHLDAGRGALGAGSRGVLRG